MTYQTKSVLVDAIRFTRDNVKDVLKFTEGKESITTEIHPYGKSYCSIDTPQGGMKALLGDYIVKGLDGEFLPYKPDIFEKLYEPVE